MLVTSLRLRRRHLCIACIVAIITLLAVAMGQQPSQAHGYIIRAIPANESVLSHSPTRIQIWFTEALEPKFSTLSLADSTGNDIPLTDVGLPPTNLSQITARLTSPLPDGAYVVTIRAAFASDGHVVTDTLVFWVGQRTGSVTVNGPSQDASVLEVLWRFLTLVGLNVLFGTTLLYQVVLVPGWGNAAYVAGRLPARVMTRLYALMWAALILALVGSLFAVLQQASVLFATDLGTVLQNGLWNIVLRGTQFGDALTYRLGFIILAGALVGAAVYLTPRRPEFVTLLWTLNVATTAAALGTVSWNSHAAGSTLWPLAAVGVDWLHLLATGAWVGGLAALTLALPAALAPLTGENRRAALAVALKRFSSVGVAAVLMLTVTGIYSALLSIRQPTDLPDTHYGLTLLAKVALIVPLLLLALVHHLIAVPDGRLRSFSQRWHLVERLEGLVSSLRLEAVIALVVILFAALLTAAPPPVPPEALNKVVAPVQVQTVGSVQVSLSLDPDASGDNSYEVTLLKAGQPLNAAQVRVQFVYPSLDKRSTPLVLDAAGDGDYLGAGSELNRAGDWLVLVDITESASPTPSPIQAAFQWSVPTVSPVTPTRQPTLLNWLSAAGVIAVLAILFVPLLWRTLRTMHVQPEAITVAVLAVVATVVLVIVGMAVLSDAAQRMDALRNPIPAVVNPVLPDNLSVTAGEQLYVNNCAACHGPAGAGDGPLAGATPPPDLSRRLAERNDEELFQSITRHKGTTFSLTDQQVWNVINYLRSEAFSAAKAQP